MVSQAKALAQDELQQAATSAPVEGATPVSYMDLVDV